MAIINPTELFDRLSGVALDDDDRGLLLWWIRFGSFVIAAIVAMLGVLTFYGKADAKYLAGIAEITIGAVVALVLIFIAGTVQLKNSTTRSIMQASGKGGPAAAPAPQATGGTTINLNSPQETVAPIAAPEIAGDVKEVKQKVNVIDANVKEVKEQTKKDAAVAVSEVVKTIKKEVVKAVNTRRRS